VEDDLLIVSPTSSSPPAHWEVSQYVNGEMYTQEETADRIELFTMGSCQIVKKENEAAAAEAEEAVAGSMDVLAKIGVEQEEEEDNDKDRPKEVGVPSGGAASGTTAAAEGDAAKGGEASAAKPGDSSTPAGAAAAVPAKVDAEGFVINEAQEKAKDLFRKDSAGSGGEADRFGVVWSDLGD